MLAAGLGAELLAELLRVPPMLLLLGAGALLGPSVAGAIDIPLDSMGAQLILTLGVSFILFHGGLQLSLTILSKVAIGLLMLVIPGVVLTALLTGGVAAAVFGVPLTTGLLIGAALSPTDPAILIPLFERMRLRAKVSQTIIAESALNDPTGAVLALAFAGVVLSGSASLTTPMTDFLVDLALSTALGIVFGIVLSAVVSSRRTGIWRESAAIVVIAVVAGSFFSIDSAGGSGYLGAFLAGPHPREHAAPGTRHAQPSRGRDARVRLDGVALDGDARLHHARGEPALARDGRPFLAGSRSPRDAHLRRTAARRPRVPARRPARLVDAGGARLPRLDPRDGGCSGRACWDHCQHARARLRTGRHVGRARDHRHARPSVDDEALARPQAGAARRRRDSRLRRRRSPLLRASAQPPAHDHSRQARDRDRRRRSRPGPHGRSRDLGNEQPRRQVRRRT